MSHTDDVIHQWGPQLLRQRAAGLVSEGERGRVGKVVGAEWNDWDNDRAVGFDDGSKYVSGEYECDI